MSCGLAHQKEQASRMAAPGRVYFSGSRLRSAGMLSLSTPLDARSDIAYRNRRLLINVIWFNKWTAHIREPAAKRLCRADTMHGCILWSDNPNSAYARG